MGTATTRMTVEEYYAASVGGDHTQLVEGEIVVSEPRPMHALLQTRLTVALFGWTQAADGRGLAIVTTNVELDAYNANGPDVLCFAEEHRPTDRPLPVPGARTRPVRRDTL